MLCSLHAASLLFLAPGTQEIPQQLLTLPSNDESQIGKISLPRSQIQIKRRKPTRLFHNLPRHFGQVDAAAVAADINDGDELDRAELVDAVGDGGGERRVMPALDCEAE